MSTLSEIAANHAKNILALEAESARLNGQCAPILQVFETPHVLVLEQLPPHVIAAISENLSAQTLCHPG
ncbi:hypothetical protein [Pseudomonas floridensis]|uniref:hypothetical protein n=1 Tax=Pseudomonas floridensis TaxID=1958950 RepID=UPI0012FFCE38|nr:hypothetical protein [Pseudomonas floridensis]